jgi:multiple sugar transport system permease protein
MQKTRMKQLSGIARMERTWGVLLALPAMLGFLVFTVSPIIASLWISLTDWEIGARNIALVGMQNYRHMLMDDPLFWKSLTVTTYYSLGSVPLGLLVAFTIAMLLNQEVKGRAVFRTIFYLPAIVPAIANTMLWLWLFDPDFGLLNTALGAVGLPESQWIYHSQSAVPSLILMSTWGVGNAVLIFLAGLQGVPAHLYDAVSVDGGNAWHRFQHVTLPMMTPTIFYNLVVGLVAAFQVFTEAYVMTQGGPSNATLFYVYYLYRTAFTLLRMGYASSLAWVLFLLIVLLSILVFRSSRHWVYYESEGRG